jgi:class 3 adenylate cyclase
MISIGKALCGFIGGKRFRFDVWSSDVTMANKMESSGRAGWVHISHATYEQVHTEYSFENAEKYSGYSTYFVVPDEKRKLKLPTVADTLLANSSVMIATQLSTQLSRSASIKFGSKSAISENHSCEENEAEVEEPKDKEETLIKAIHDIEFFRPNMNIFTLFFTNRLEQQYKNFLLGYKAIEDNNDVNEFTQLLEKNSVKFWSNPPNTLFSSLVISFLINFFISLAYMLSYIAANGEFKNSEKIFLKILIPFLIINITQLIFVLIYFFKFTTFLHKNKNQTTLFTYNNANSKENSDSETDPTAANNTRLMLKNQQQPGYMKTSTKTEFKRIKNMNLKISLLYLISFIFISSVPVFMLTNGLSVFCHFVNMDPSNLSQRNIFLIYYSIAYVISLINVCVFIQLNKLFKHFLIFVFTFLYFLFFFYLNYHLCPNAEQSQATAAANATNLPESDLNTNYFNLLDRNYILILDFVLYLIFLYIINRQFEIMNRLAFVCDQDSNTQTKTNKEQKELASWLIDVVLPAHVVEHVQARKQYSRNYDCVGVLFVSLCNYSEFYEEKFLGGRELIRILNEITVDFDRLFDEPKYQNIEKIKTIGSTYMIASGLSNNENASSNQNKQQHLYDLIDFALNLWQKLDTFNNDAMSVCHFQFQMRMGFNFGPVTAGVIGEERLLYDIWGDTVNVASRMDSTGQAGVLQTPENVASFLSDKYIFHHRGEIQVKGKDKMITYLLKPKENEKLSGLSGALLPD